MAITKNPARQCPITAYVDINLADLTSAVAFDAIALPTNAVVLTGHLLTTEAWNSTSSDVAVIGDVTTANRYLGSTSIVTNATRTALVPTGFTVTATQPNIKITWTSGGGTPTTGKLRLEVTYYIKGRSEFTQD